MRAEQLMSKPIVKCHVNDTLDAAAQLMWDHDCGAVVVVRSDGRLAGMLTDRDLAMATHFQAKPLHEILVNTAMAQHPIAAFANQKISEVEQLMAKHQVHRIPIIDDEHRPIGVISMTDLAIESTQPDTRLASNVPQIAYTLAAICRPRPRRPLA